MDEKHFTISIEVSSDDIDQLGHVNNVVYVRWVQEVAAAHWESVAPRALREKYYWVVLRHEINYKSPAVAGDAITGETWVGEHNGARFDRFVRLTNANTGKVLAEAKTTWCMLDASGMRPQRITAEILNIL